MEGWTAASPSPEPQERTTTYYHITPHSAAAGYSNGCSSSPELELSALPSHEKEDNEEYFEDCQSISESGGVESFRSTVCLRFEYNYNLQLLYMCFVTVY